VAKLPLSLGRSLTAISDARDTVSKPASIVLSGDDALVQRARDKFSEGGTIPSTVTIDAFSGPAGAAAGAGDLLVVLTTPEKEAQVRASLGSAVRTGSVILAVDQGPGTTGRETYLANGAVRMPFSDSDAGWERLFSLCAEAAGDRGIALGRTYPVVRRAAARRLIGKTAWQNVLIALLFFIPGSDMPPMTLNQVRMFLKIAATYGEPLTTDRAVELVGILGLGFGFRGVGRRLARWMPGFAVIMRMLTAYSATIAVGLGAIAYFEKGAPASTSKLIALARNIRR
jgi:uncharacterized protein (DUF697 family)